MKTSNESRKEDSGKHSFRKPKEPVLCVLEETSLKGRARSLYIKYNIGLKIALKGMVLQ